MESFIILLEKKMFAALLTHNYVSSMVAYLRLKVCCWTRCQYITFLFKSNILEILFSPVNMYNIYLYEITLIVYIVLSNSLYPTKHFYMTNVMTSGLTFSSVDNFHSDIELLKNLHRFYLFVCPKECIYCIPPTCIPPHISIGVYTSPWFTLYLSLYI